MSDLNLEFGGRRWLRYAEAGAVLGVSGEAIRMMVRRGRLPYTAFGKNIYIDRQDIDRVMEAGKTHAALGSIK